MRIKNEIIKVKARKLAERDWWKENKKEIEAGAFIPTKLIQYSIGRRIREWKNKLAKVV